MRENKLTDAELIEYNRLWPKVGRPEFTNEEQHRFVVLYNKMHGENATEGLTLAEKIELNLLLEKQSSRTEYFTQQQFDRLKFLIAIESAAAGSPQAADIRDARQKVLDKFTGIKHTELFYTDATFRSVVESLARGADPYQIIEELINGRIAQMKAFQKYVENRHPNF